MLLKIGRRASLLTRYGAPEAGPFGLVLKKKVKRPTPFVMSADVDSTSRE